jgi:polyisoprenoid-binding protein YceI
MPAATVSTWTIDPVHSNIEFAVQYIGISTFKGRFRNVTGTIQTDEESPAHSSVAASIDVSSVDTLIAPFSERLLSEDFFAAETYPAITFQSTDVQVVDARHALISGQLTLRGVTQAVVLDTTYHGQAIHPFSGKLNAAFTATTQIERSDFGLGWNVAMDSGAKAIGERVRLTLDIHTVRED